MKYRRVRRKVRFDRTFASESKMKVVKSSFLKLCRLCFLIRMRSKMQKLYIGADHGGFELKEKIKAYLSKKGIKFEDLGSTEYDKTDDYPDYAILVAEKVSKNNGKGILLCRTGHGVCIVANKLNSVRAVTCRNKEEAVKSREHVDANLLCIPGDYLTLEEVQEIIGAWLNTNFSNAERHIRRLGKIQKIESSRNM